MRKIISKPKFPRLNLGRSIKVNKLVNIPLSLEEDRVFSLLTDKRISEKGKTLSHAEVWGK